MAAATSGPPIPENSDACVIGLIFLLFGCDFRRLVPALGANKPVQVGVVFMPAVGAGGGYFVVSHVKKGV